jgi:hypothetical protein
LDVVRERAPCRGTQPKLCTAEIIWNAIDTLLQHRQEREASPQLFGDVVVIMPSAQSRWICVHVDADAFCRGAQDFVQWGSFGVDPRDDFALTWRLSKKDMVFEDHA